VLRPEPGVLRIEASVAQGGDPDRWAEVVKVHLERFGQREELDVVWDCERGLGLSRAGLRGTQYRPPSMDRP